MLRMRRIIISAILISALAGGLLPRFLVSVEASPTEERQALEEELRKLEEEISRYDQDIQKTEKEKKTLESKISSLKSKINKLDLQIRQSNIVIKDINLQIKDTEDSITKTSLEIDEAKVRLAAILRTIYEEDQKALVEILLSDGFSEFFDDLVALEALNASNKQLLENIKSLKVSLENQKLALDEERETLEKQVQVQTLQKEEGEKAKKDQEYFLKLTETEYQKYLKQKADVEKIAQSIRSRIFELIGVPEAPTFGEAYEIAKFTYTMTGIRPALLLAVLTQESNIGKNVGQCYLTDFQTGNGVKAKTGQAVSKVMNPTRDVSYFLQITGVLGRDSKNTPVSCPMSIGWGGAMGPAQFIPSTWANSQYNYGQKVSELTGKPADPWNIKDAFLAAGLYLKNLGAESNEFRAVMKYFSGSSWSKWEEFYGKSVLSIASQYEEDIKHLSQ